MINELLSNNLTSLTKQLTTKKEIDLIYYNIKKNNNKQYLTCNIICDVDNVIGNENLLKEIVANMEIAKALYSKTNIVFNYCVKTSKAFEEDLIESKEKVLADLTSGNIIYSNDEYFDNYFIESNNSEKSRH